MALWHRKSIEQQRRERGPRIEQLVGGDFDIGRDDLYPDRKEGDWRLLHSTAGGYEAFLVSSACEALEADLQGQSFVQEADLITMRQAAWAAIDLALAVERIDQQLAKQSPHKLKEQVLFLVRRTPRQELDSQIEKTVAWVEQLTDPQMQAGLRQALSSRARLLAETRSAADAFIEMARQARWISTTMEEAGEPLIVDEVALASARASIQQASQISNLLVSGVAEALGVDGPPALAELDSGDALPARAIADTAVEPQL